VSTKSTETGASGKEPKTKGPKIIKLKPRVVVYREKHGVFAVKKVGVSHARTRKATERRKAKPSQATKGRAKNNPTKAQDHRKGRKATRK